MTGTEGSERMGVSVDDVRAVAGRLPRAYEVLVRDRVKWRVGRIVFAALSRDETVIGFGYPKEERASRVAAEPAVFLLPPESDLRYDWICARMEALDAARMRELIEDAWMMTVPKKVWTEYLALNPR